MYYLGVISTIRAYFDETIKQIANNYSLKEMEYHVLAYLGQNSDKNTASEIVKSLKASKSHISITVQALTEKGFIEQYQKADNNKTIHLQLTEKGKQIFQESLSGFEDYLKQSSKGFDKEEIELFRSLVNRLYVNSLEGLDKK